jgi:hypothetical protein
MRLKGFYKLQFFYMTSLFAQLVNLFHFIPVITVIICLCEFLVMTEPAIFVKFVEWRPV